jgi:hypothetical protein
MGQGERAHQPTKGLSAPPTPSHVTRRGGGATPRAAAPPGLGGKFPRGWGRPNPSRVSPVAAAPPLGNPRAPPPPPFPLYIVREREGSRTLPLAQPSSSSNTSSSSVVLGEALPENHELHHHHAVVLSEFSLNFSSHLAGSRRRRHLPTVRVLNVEVPSVRRAVIGDLDHDEYDSINPVHLNASARDLQGYVDALLPSRC